MSAIEDEHRRTLRAQLVERHAAAVLVGQRERGRALLQRRTFRVRAQSACEERE